MGWFKVCFGIRRNENTPNKLLVASSLQEDKVKVSNTHTQAQSIYISIKLYQFMA